MGTLYCRPEPGEVPILIEVPEEQRLLHPHAPSYGGQADPFISPDWIFSSLEQAGGWQELFDMFNGRCRICGAAWMKFCRRRATREVSGYRLHTPKGWDGRPARRRGR